MKFFLALTLIFSSVALLSSSAQAQFHIGGGCMIVNDDGTELCEEDDYKNLEEISIEDSLSSLEELVKDIPGLNLLFRKIATQREWFLEERTFNPEYCAPQSISESQKNYEIVACQGPTEVRISKKFWLTATLGQKRDLVLHELMMSYFFDKDKSSFHARKATYIILNGIKKDYYKARTQLNQLGFPLLRVTSELQFFRNLSQVLKADICTGNIEGINEKAQKYIDASWDVIVIFDPGFLNWTESKITEILSSLEVQSHICQQPDLYKKLIDLSIEDDIFL